MQLTMTDDSGLKSMMYNAGSIDKNRVTNRRTLFESCGYSKRTDRGSIHYKEEEQVIRNRKKTIHDSQDGTMTTYVRKGEQRIPMQIVHVLVHSCAYL
jgi:hypothetical protein